MPLGTSLSLGLLALGAATLARQRLALAAGAAAIVWLWVWSTPAVSDWLRGSIERKVPAVTASAMPSADAIVVLGGGMSGALAPWRPYPDLNSAADRVWHAARLYHAGKAPWVVLSGGVGAFPSATGDEATAMAVLLADLGVPAATLVLETQSRTTSENALASAPMLSTLGARRVILVTSALHMPRALATFRIQGVEVIPAPTDVEVVPRPFHVMRWVPSASALDSSSRAIHELLGLARCRLAGC